MSVRLTVNHLPGIPKVRCRDPGQVYTSYIHARTKGIARMENKENTITRYKGISRMGTSIMRYKGISKIGTRTCQ